MQKIIKVYWPTGIAIVIFIAVFIINYNNIDCIAVLNDEFGYWGNAATLTGMDWSSLLSQTPFYSMGYSLVLIPLFKLGIPMSAMYRIAIFMNMLFLFISYLCANYIAGSLYPDIDQKLCQLISFVVASSGVMLFYSQIAWCETFLSMLMWALVALFVRLERKWSYAVPPVIVSVAFMIYLTHQRAVLLLPVAVILLLAICIEKKKFASAGCVLIMSVLSIVLYRHLHNWQIKVVYGASEMSNMNSVTVTTSFVGDYLGKMFQNIGSIFISIICKLGVIMLSTYYAFPIACKKYIDRLIRKDHTYWGTWTLILAASILMLALTSTQMYGTSRKDLVVYSRYMDFVIPPIAMISMCELLNNFHQNRNIYIVSVSATVPILLISMNVIEHSDMYFNVLCSPLWGSLIEYYNNTFMAGIIIIEVSLLILVSFILANKLSSRKAVYLFTIFLTIPCFFSFAYSNGHTNKIRRGNYSHISGIYDVIKEHSDNAVFYSLPDFEDEITADIYIKYLQTLLYNRPLENLNGIDTIKEESLIIEKKTIHDKELMKSCELLEDKGEYLLYMYYD